MENQFVWIAYTISNLVSLLFLWAAIKRPRLARLMFLLLFGWASGFNYMTAHQHPDAYLMYDSIIPLYSNFIHGWFKANITGFVTFVAIGQAFIAYGMLLHDWWVKIASIGAIIFLLSIAPLGLNAAFPFSITMSVAAFLTMKKDQLDYLWRS